MAVCKILSSLFICGGAFLLCLSVWIGITNTIFGWESTKMSLQFLAMLSFTLFVSAKAKSTVSSLATALVFCVLPVLMTSIFPEKVGLWMQCLLPAGGISMGNSFLYALVFFAVI